MSQVTTISWENSAFGHNRRGWSCSYFAGALDRFDRIAKRLKIQPLSKWVFEDIEILQEALDGCAEELEQADEIYPDVEERSRFCQEQLDTMRSLEARMQKLENQEQ